MLNQNHRFGIEVEFNTTASDGTVVDFLRREGLSASITTRSMNPTGQWCVKYDGSIGSGWEIVSPILTAAEMPGQVRAMGRALLHLRTEGGYTVRPGRQCGLHVHLSGIGEHDTDKLRNFARRFMNFEDTFDLMQPASRQNNQYCQSNLRRFGHWGNTVAQRCEAMWTTLGNCGNVHDIVRWVSPDRYYKLNLQSLFRHGTVEIRHHSATVSGEKVVHWATFLSSFADVSQHAVRVWKRKEATQPERFRKLMRGVPARTRDYLRQRVATLHGGTFPGEEAPAPAAGRTVHVNVGGTPTEIQIDTLIAA